MDVPERRDPQRRQAALGRTEQSHVDEVRRHGCERDTAGGQQDEPQDQPDVGARRGQDPPVGRLLHDEGNDDPAHRRDQGQHHRDADAFAELG